MGKRLGQVIRELREGWDCSTAGFWAFSLLVAFAFLGFTEWALRSGLVFSIPESYLLRTPIDDATHIAFKLHREKRLKDSRIPLYLFGGSSFREALVGESELISKLDPSTRERIRLVKLTACAQTPADMIRILQALPQGPGLILIGTSLTLFSFPPDYYVRKLRAATLEPPLPEIEPLLQMQGISWSHPPLRVSAWLEHWTGWLRERRQPLRQITLSTVYKENFLDDEPANSEQVMISLEDDIRNFGQHGEFNRHILSLAIELAYQKGYSVSFLPLPMSRKGKDTAGPVYFSYGSMEERVTQKLKLPYFQMRDLDLKENDFHDPRHVSSTGREKFTRSFLEAIGPFLEKSIPRTVMNGL